MVHITLHNKQVQFCGKYFSKTWSNSLIYHPIINIYQKLNTQFYCTIRIIN